jgi:5-methylcytosine-specific restriction endonuclease McrA
MDKTIDGDVYMEQKRAKARDASRKWRLEYPGESSKNSRLYRLKYPERVKESRRNQYEIHKEDALKAYREWYKTHQEQKKEYMHKWYLMHPEKYYEYVRNRHARKIIAGGTITTEEWEAILQKYGNKCLRCGSIESLTMDHVIPLNPGTNTVDNIQPLCRSCNSKKRRETIDYRSF